MYLPVILEPPKVEFDRMYPSGLQIRVGSSQTISATVSGVPAPSITWYKDGKALKPTQAKVVSEESNTSITFTDIEADASGNYRVVVENDVGSSSADVYVKVKG